MLWKCQQCQLFTASYCIYGYKFWFHHTFEHTFENKLIELVSHLSYDNRLSCRVVCTIRYIYISTEPAGGTTFPPTREDIYSFSTYWVCIAREIYKSSAHEAPTTQNFRNKREKRGVFKMGLWHWTPDSCIVVGTKVLVWSWWFDEYLRISNSFDDPLHLLNLPLWHQLGPTTEKILKIQIHGFYHVIRNKCHALKN